jgi:hypothetical protein
VDLDNPVQGLKFGTPGEVISGETRSATRGYWIVKDSSGHLNSFSDDRFHLWFSESPYEITEEQKNFMEKEMEYVRMMEVEGNWRSAVKIQNDRANKAELELGEVTKERDKAWARAEANQRAANTERERAEAAEMQLADISINGDGFSVNSISLLMALPPTATPRTIKEIERDAVNAIKRVSVVEKERERLIVNINNCRERLLMMIYKRDVTTAEEERQSLEEVTQSTVDLIHRLREKGESVCSRMNHMAMMLLSEMHVAGQALELEDIVRGVLTNIRALRKEISEARQARRGHEE